MLLSHAGELEGRGRSEDDLAYLRDEREFRNFLMVELPVGDFAFTLVRQFMLDVYHRELYALLTGSADETLAAIASKAVKECAYHVRRSGEWILRLGDGTSESHDRAQSALDELWGYSHELFAGDAVDRAMTDAKVVPDLADVCEPWRREVEATLTEATLQIPHDDWQATGGREGVHTEHMGHLLAELQVLQRTYPGLEW